MKAQPPPTVRLFEPAPTTVDLAPASALTLGAPADGSAEAKAAAGWVRPPSTFRAPALLSVARCEADAGTPGAETYRLTFSDGMQWHAAVYAGGDPDLAPLVLVPGYSGNFGYLHPVVERYLRPEGLSVVLLQPAGQGMPGVYSHNPSRADGPEYTIEGSAALHLVGALKGISARFFDDKPVVVGGHSRAGYMMRMLAAGLRAIDRQGDRLVIGRTPATDAELKQVVSRIVPILSPVKLDEEIVRGALALPKALRDIQEVQDLTTQVRQSFRSSLDLLSLGFDILSNGRTKRQRDAVLDREEGRQDAGARRLAAKLALSDDQGPPMTEETRAGLSLMRKMLGADAKRRQALSLEDVTHMLQYWGVTPPPPAAAEEFERFRGNGGWLSQSADRDGKALKPLRALWTARRNGELVPMDLVHAEDDGGVDVFVKEAARDPRSRNLLVSGGHGGALFHPESGRQIATFLKQLCSPAPAQ